MPALNQWTNWKTLCALGLCDQDTQAALHGFAYARYRHFAAAAGLSPMHDLASLTPVPAQAWHWFETYLRLHTNRAGKCYKDWLFARCGGEGGLSIDAIQGGASLLMRDVVRERIRREFPGKMMVAFDAPFPGVAGARLPGLDELLADTGCPDAAETVARRELGTMAAAEAQAAMASMNHRQRVALLARELGYSLVHAEVLAVAGCGKSVLNTAYHDALLGVAGHVRSRYPREAQSTLASLAILVFDRIRQLVTEWGKSELRCTRLFNCSKGIGDCNFPPDHTGKIPHARIT